MAKAYRAKRRERYGDYEARWSAIDALVEERPDIPEEHIQPIVSVIIVIAALDHKDWLWDRVNGLLRDDRVK